MNLDSTISLPSSEDVELHVFGPGYGESLLIHTGQGRWLIVDSCRKAKAAAPAAIEWLEHIGVDPSQAVTHIIATHWHDDHIRGLGETLERCTNATFVCSNALLSKELLALTEDAAQPLMGHASGVDEIRRVVAELRRRKKDDKARILQLSGEAYISSPVSAKRYKPKERTVSWAYEGKQPTISRGMGHIYARTSAVDSTKNWEIQLFEGALPLANA